MNNFERGLVPEKAMRIGLDQVLKNNGITFDRSIKGEGRFRKNEWSNGLEVSSWSPAELRIIADYIDAHPECIKVEPPDPANNQFSSGVTGSQGCSGVVGKQPDHLELDALLGKL